MRWQRITAGIVFVTAAATLPGAWSRRDAAELYDGDLDAQLELARGMDVWLRDDDVHTSSFSTGTARFDGEWLFATWMMGAMGYGQIALEHPELREEYAARMDACIERILRPESRAFERSAWGSDPIDDLGTRRAHAAWLGYLDLALALHVRLDPGSRWRELHERIVAHLGRRLDRASIGLLETYPGEVFPIDNAAFIGALGISGAGPDNPRVASFRETLESRYRDPSSGLLYQRVRARDGAPVDDARGSGTLLAAYFLSYADPALASSLYRSCRSALYREALGFGAMRERPGGGMLDGDIDSGVVILGLGTSSSGFAIGVSRIARDRDAYVALTATARLVGAPTEEGRGVRFALGGPVGDALMFAMATAPRAGS